MNKFIFTLLFAISSTFAFCQVANTIESLPNSVSFQANSPVRDQPNHSGNLLFRTKDITKAALLDRIGEYLSVKIDSQNVFISYAFLVQNTEEIKEFAYKIRYEAKVNAQAIKDSTLKEQFRQEQLALNEDFQEKLKEMTEKYGAVNGKKVALRSVWISMTEEMLIDSWGYPSDINTTALAGLVKKQYVYPNYQYVYVENGVVTAWQD